MLAIREATRPSRGSKGVINRHSSHLGLDSDGLTNMTEEEADKKQEMEIIRRLSKSLIIEILTKIQNLQSG